MTHRLLLVPALLALLAPGSAADLQLPTSFEVRKEAQELLTDLAKAAPGDEGPLLERAAALLDRSGRDLVATPDGARPLALVITEALAKARLEATFAGSYAERAAQALASARTDSDTERVAFGYPGTPAAAMAWERLARRAWDRGRPGDALAALRQAPPSPGRDQRMEAAASLVVPREGPPAPVALAGLRKSWSLALPQRLAAPAPLLQRRRKENALAPLRLALGRPLGEVVAVADGLRLHVIDHLLGQPQGEGLVLGDQALPPATCRPAALEDGWVAVGLREQRLVLVRADRAGGQRWRVQSPDLGFGVVPSAPVVLDGQVIVAVQTNDGEAAEVQVMAWRLADGRPAWSTTVGRAGGPRGWGGSLEDRQRPLLTVHDGSLLLVADVGRLVRLSSGGRIDRWWTYRADQPEPAVDEPERQRAGGLASDGRWAVVAPADAPGLLLVLEGSGDPRPYRGDGAGGDLLAVAGGTAWVGGNRLVALHLATGRPQWDQPLAATALHPGPDHLLVTTRERLVVVDRRDGTAIDTWTLPAPGAAQPTDDGVVIAQSGEDAVTLAAWGDPGPARARLTAAAAQGSWNAAAALASLSAGAQQEGEAITWALEAVRLGAPVEYVRKAAALVRRRLDQPGDPVVAARHLAQFADLAGREPALAPELLWWRAHLATQPAERQAYYEQLLAGPAALFEGPKGVAVDIRLLAAARLGKPWTWAEDPPARPGPGQPWERPGRRAPGALTTGSTLIGYLDGVLAAYDLTTGTERWWRRPQRPLLGVQSGDARADGVALAQVIPGSSAAAAGLRSGDVLLRLNGQPMRSFTGDLMPAVLALGVRGAFTAVVRRGAEEVTCQGTLGGELVTPVAADASTVLVWPTGLARAAGRAAQPAPEGLWVEALDATTGVRRWRQAIAPATSEGLPARPLLIGGLAVLADGPDLIARSGPDGAERWRLAGVADRLAQARTAAGLLWLPGDERSLLVDPRRGTVVAEVPLTADEVLVDGHDLVAASEGRLWRVDLAEARLAWSVTDIGQVVAVAGDGVWALSSAGPLVLLDRASGRERRRYGDWPTVHERRRVGDLLVLNGQAGPNRSWLAGVNLAGGSVAWSLGLPPGSEVLALADDGQGPAAVLGSSTGATAVLHLGNDVPLRGLTPLPSQTGLWVQPMPDGAVVLDEQGGRRLPLTPLGDRPRAWAAGDAPQTVPGIGEFRLEGTLGGVRLRWRPAQPTTTLALDVAEAGEALAFGAVRTEITAAGVLTGTTAGSPWTVVSAPKDGEVIIDLLTNRLAGAPLLVRLADAGQADPRWWWTRSWRLVTGAR